MEVSQWVVSLLDSTVRSTARAVGGEEREKADPVRRQDCPQDG
jgi:hypothetical protein